MVQEKENYIHQRARVTGGDVHSVLFELADESAASCRKGRMILKGEKERDAWESYLAGYVAFHIQTPRYRLDEILQTQK